ncbi:MAG: hypothetical protein U9N07_06095, partial [Euryarchaeota archaeon]|nr:hypothetical protein [Euryarchaeota archaeon]
MNRRDGSRSLLITMLLLFAVSTSAGANDSVQGLSDPCCYNFSNDPMKQFFEERIPGREDVAQNWKEPETFGLEGQSGMADEWPLPPGLEEARDLAENQSLPAVFSRSIDDVKDLEQIESTYFRVGGEVLWKEGFPTPTNQNIWTDACITEDMDCDDNPDVLVHVRRYDPDTGIYTYTVIAKKGSDGTHLWEESVSGEYAYMYAYPVPDLDCDDKADVLVSIYEYDPDTDTYTYTVIAKRGKDGTHLWEESVSGTYAYLYADLVPDLDCDGKPDFLVHQRTCTDGRCTYTVIAKKGSNGTHLWEESVTGTYAYIYAYPVPDLDCDDKADVLVSIHRYDPDTDTYTYTVIAKRGKDGTHLWEESVTGKNVYLYADLVPDLDCDGKPDFLVHQRTCTDGRCTYTVIAKKGSNGTHLWEESVTGTYAYIYAYPVPDLDCDDKADVLVSIHRYDPDTDTYTYTVIAKRGKDGTHLWEESVTGKNVYLYADLVPDLDCDGKPDFLVHQRTCTDGRCTYTVIAKKGSNGTHLWEESVTGTYAYIYAYPVPDLDCDDKADVLVSIYEYDPDTDTTKSTIIAKRGKDGKHLWEESVSGTYTYMDAIPIKDMDCDDKPDILVYQERYDPETERYHYKIIAKKGNDGTHL